MVPETKKNGSPCYKYIILYVDNLLAICIDAERAIREELCKFFTLKKASIGEPKFCLGISLRNVELETGANVWTFGASQYVNAALKNVEKYLKDHEKFDSPNHYNTPFTTSYSPELDMDS